MPKPSLASDPGMDPNEGGGGAFASVWPQRLDYVRFQFFIKAWTLLGQLKSQAEDSFITPGPSIRDVGVGIDI